MKGKIFNTQEVQAIIAGNKTMFREVIKPQPNEQQKYLCVDGNDNIFLTDHNEFDYFLKGDGNEIKCPYKLEQDIFCKENFFEDLTYRKFAGFEAKDDLLQINARYMKQEHSRLTLLIKEIRVEKLAEISEEDCWKEGLEELADYQDQVKVCQMAKQLDECVEDPRPHFATYWNATHRKPQEKFEASPWVWVISFEVMK